MLQLPPIPAWDSLHPVAIHFPIVLLLASPLFLLAGVCMPYRSGRYYTQAALWLILAGTGSLFLSTSTGEAAARLADVEGGVNAALETHKHLAQETRTIFLALSAILAGMLATFRFLHIGATKLATRFLPLTFLALYTVGVLFLLNTAHTGGRLVHEFGVHAMWPESASPPAEPPSREVPAAGTKYD